MENRNETTVGELFKNLPALLIFLMIRLEPIASAKYLLNELKTRAKLLKNSEEKPYEEKNPDDNDAKLIRFIEDLSVGLDSIKLDPLSDSSLKQDLYSKCKRILNYLVSNTEGATTEQIHFFSDSSAENKNYVEAAIPPDYYLAANNVLDSKQNRKTLEEDIVRFLKKYPEIPERCGEVLLERMDVLRALLAFKDVQQLILSDPKVLLNFLFKTDQNAHIDEEEASEVEVDEEEASEVEVDEEEESEVEAYEDRFEDLRVINNLIIYHVENDRKAVSKTPFASPTIDFLSAPLIELLLNDNQHTILKRFKLIGSDRPVLTDWTDPSFSPHDDETEKIRAYIQCLIEIYDYLPPEHRQRFLEILAEDIPILNNVLFNEKFNPDTTSERKKSFLADFLKIIEAKLLNDVVPFTSIIPNQAILDKLCEYLPASKTQLTKLFSIYKDNSLLELFNYFVETKNRAALSKFLDILKTHEATNPMTVEILNGLLASLKVAKVSAQNDTEFKFFLEELENGIKAAQRGKVPSLQVLAKNKSTETFFQREKNGKSETTSSTDSEKNPSKKRSKEEMSDDELEKSSKPQSKKTKLSDTPSDTQKLFSLISESVTRQQKQPLPEEDLTITSFFKM